MTKRIFLIHGWEGYPKEGWRPWLENKMKKKGHKVFIPAMPDTVNPTKDKWVKHLSKIVGNPSEDCYFVGHSLGCITILRYLESLSKGQAVGGVIFVAGFANDLEHEDYKGELSSFFPKPVDWKKVKSVCKQFEVIHSDDDPWVPIKFGEELADNLDAKFIKVHGMKHFSGDDGIMEAPVVLTNLLKIIK